MLWGSREYATPWASKRSETQSDLLGATVALAEYEVRGARDVVVVGRRGVYLVGNLHAKNGFQVGVSAGGADLFAVAASGNEGFAVGARGTIVHASFDAPPKDPGF